MPSANPFIENDVAGRYFVGREVERGEIDGLLQQVSDGNSVGAVIAGAHGRGKSSLLQQLERMAVDNGFVVAWSECDEGQSAKEQANSFLRRLCDSVDHAVGGTTYTTDWDRGNAAELMRTNRASILKTDDLAQDIGTLLEAIQPLPAKPGIILSLDEAQALDPAIISQLRNATKRLRHFAIILTYRLDDLSADRDRIKVLTRDWLSAGAVHADRDIGTAAFFNQIIPVGPFDSAETARECITRRLRDTGISFGQSALGAIIEISEFVPRYIIQFCHPIYDHCVQHQITNATLETVDFVFRAHHVSTLRDVEDALSVVPDAQCVFLAALIRLNGSASVDQLAEAVLGDIALTSPESARLHVTAFFDQFACEGMWLDNGNVRITHARIKHAIRIHLGRSAHAT